MTHEKQEKKGKKHPEERESAEKPGDADETAGEGGAATPVEHPRSVESPLDLEALKAKAQERDEFLKLLQRTAAEFSNYRKRIERERAEWTDRAFGEFVLKLLPALDDVDRALSHAREGADFEALVAGVRLIEKKFHDILKWNGVESFEAREGPFDPEEHEAAAVEQTDRVPDGTVTGTLQKGYRFRGGVLRPAKVKVARKTPAAEGAPEAAGNAERKPNGPKAEGETERPKAEG
jgi:molecular chaperone GrpE